MDCPSSHLGPPDPDGIFLTDLRWKMLHYVVPSQVLANVLHVLVALLGVRPCSSSPGNMAQEASGGSSQASQFLRPIFAASRVQMILKGPPLPEALQHHLGGRTAKASHKNPIRALTNGILA